MSATPLICQDVTQEEVAGVWPHQSTSRNEGSRLHPHPTHQPCLHSHPYSRWRPAPIQQQGWWIHHHGFLWQICEVWYNLFLLLGFHTSFCPYTFIFSIAVKCKLRLQKVRWVSKNGIAKSDGCNLQPMYLLSPQIIKIQSRNKLFLVKP